MSVQVENLEKSMAKLTIEVSAEDFEKAVQQAYLKQKNKINIQGFRKGKAPRKIIEKMYGEGIFFEDAANALIPEEYDKAAQESGLDIVSRPQIDVTQIEKGKSFIFTAEVAVKPEVTLGQYKGIEIDKVNFEVTDEDMQVEIDNVREENARTITVDDRAVQDKDIVTIDFDGYMDGEQFDGGYAEDYALTIGSHSFIGDFEEQLIGKNIGDDVDVNVTFPEDYHASELAGKPALFKVKIKEIKMKELPEFDDDMVQDISEFNTVDEYKEDLRKELTEKKKVVAQSEKEDAVIAKIVENAAMEIPEPMVDTQVRQMADEFAQRIQAQGLTLEQYFMFTGSNANDFMKQLRPQAMKRIESRLVLEAVVKAEDLKAEDAAFEAEIQKMADAYKMDIETVKERLDEDTKKLIMDDLAVQKAVDFVTENAVEK